MSPVVKRSIRIAGHTTSISLEDEFWSDLVAIAERMGITMTELITRIDAERDGNLSSAIRLRVLEEAKSRRRR